MNFIIVTRIDNTSMLIAVDAIECISKPLNATTEDGGAVIHFKSGSFVTTQESVADLVELMESEDDNLG